jgi:2-methylcitrate dehydratase PrpD
MIDTPERLLAEFAAEGDATGGGARERARLLLADAAVLSQANSEVPGFQAVHELGVGSGTHLSWASGNRLGPSDAVFANACAIHARFQDDTDMSTWSHPGSFVVPAGVAATIGSGGSLGCLLDALVIGYSAIRWLGADGVVAAGLKARGLRPSPTFAPLGAAIASARALGLDRDAAAQAINAAAIIGRGTLHSVGGGGDDWCLHNAGAARDGFVLALAAQRGMRSASGALTAHDGFLRTVTGSEDVPDLWRTAPTGDLIEGVWHKALPVLGDVMSAALAAREIGRRLEGRAVIAATVQMNANYARFPGTQQRPPYASATAAQASVRFVTAQLLVHGDLRYGDLVRRDDPEVLRLADAIDVVPSEHMQYEDAIVEVQTAAGTERCRAADLPSTYFWRDRAEQFDRAEHILGDRGVHISRTILDADEAEDLEQVLERALTIRTSVGNERARS